MIFEGDTNASLIAGGGNNSIQRMEPGQGIYPGQEQENPIRA